MFLSITQVLRTHSSIGSSVSPSLRYSRQFLSLRRLADRTDFKAAAVSFIVSADCAQRTAAVAFVGAAGTPPTALTVPSSSLPPTFNYASSQVPGHFGFHACRHEILKDSGGDVVPYPIPHRQTTGMLNSLLWIVHYPNFIHL